MNVSLGNLPVPSGGEPNGPKKKDTKSTNSNDEAGKKAAGKNDQQTNTTVTSVAASSKASGDAIKAATSVPGSVRTGNILAATLPQKPSDPTPVTTSNSNPTVAELISARSQNSLNGPGFQSANPSVNNSNTAVLQPQLASNDAAVSQNFGIKLPPAQSSGPEAWQQPGVNAFPPSGNVGPVAIAQASVIQATPADTSPAPIQQTFEAPAPAPEPPPPKEPGFKLDGEDR